ncbi:type II secretion system protein [Candidatus Pelagibacter sp.]|jgi:prepilin-type N-terminal cleavage/methylation domain-containing protein|nr:type II secretion system protein [Candidatus Pelagibacter sp.]
MRHCSQGFTLIELLVVVAIIGILSAVGVVSYSGYKSSAEKKQAEITLNSIYLAEQEYKSNNGEYYYNASTSNIVTNLFDGVDDLSEQAYEFKTTNASTLTITATKRNNKSCTISITQTNKKPNISNSC